MPKRKSIFHVREIAGGIGTQHLNEERLAAGDRESLPAPRANQLVLVSVSVVPSSCLSRGSRN